MVPGRLLGGSFLEAIFKYVEGPGLLSLSSEIAKKRSGRECHKAVKIDSFGGPFLGDQNRSGGGAKGGQNVQNSSFCILAPKSAPGPRSAQWEALGKLWETLGESLGSLWEALGKLWESFRAFLLLAPSLPPLYINILQTPDQPL